MNNNEHERSQQPPEKDLQSLFSIIANRRSVKRFSSKPVETDKVLQLVQAGALAPSSGNIQNWSFIVVTDVQKIRAMYSITLNQEPFLSAMSAIIVCGDVELAHQMYGMRGKRLYTVQNCAAATQNILLAAHAMDLGAIWVGAFDEDKLSSMFGIGDHRFRPQAIILLGYSDEVPEAKEHKPMQSFVFFNSFGNKVLRPHLVLYDWATEWKGLAKKGKDHLEHAKSKVQEKREQRQAQKAELAQNNEPSSFELAKQRIHGVIENMRRDEYRKK